MSYDQPDPVKNAETLYHHALAGGPESAVQNMRNEFEATKDDGSFKSIQQHDNYWKSVAGELERTGHLPNLTVAFVRDNKGAFDQDGNGIVSKNEVLDVQRQSRERQASGQGITFESLFADNLRSTIPSPKGNQSFYDQVAHTAKAWQVDRDAIEDADLSKWDRQNNRQGKRELKHDMTADASSPLYENNGALMHTLDASRKENGRLSRSDYKAFLHDYKERAANGQEDEVYNERNARFVHSLLKGDEPTIKNGPFRGINIDKVDRRAGYSPQDDFTPHRDVASDEVSETQSNFEAEQRQDEIDRIENAKDDNENAKNKKPDVCDNDLKNRLDDMATLRPNEGYSHVACRLLGIKIDHHYSADETREMNLLANQLKNITTGHDTHRLYVGFIMPVSNNIEKLEAINPAFKARMDQLRAQEQD
ncbi:MAG: hypothetical protein WC028_10135 [Candidatus Obscuribacterales bacterium]